MKLTSEQRLIQDMVRKFASTELQPLVPEIDKEATFPHEVIKKLSELGFLGIIIPDKYEGANLDTLSYCIVIEELSKVCGSVGIILIANNALVAHSILRYGKESQKSHWLPSLAKGKVIGAFALAEELGSSLSPEVETRAERVNGYYIISGRKSFVVNALAAELFIVFATTEKGPTALLIERGTPGFKVTEKEETLGGRSSGIGNLELKEVKVNEDNLLGKEGDGKQIWEDALDMADIGIGALAVGIGQAALEDSIRYAKERHQFGRPIGEFQLVQDMLVGMKTKVEAAKLLVYDAARKGDTKGHFSTEASIAKLFATDAALFAGTKAIQVHGGYGYIKDYPVERYFRDAQFAQIWCGPSSWQKAKIAKTLLET